MAKGKESKKHPGRKPTSRKRSDERSLVKSCRLDLATDKLLTEHLNSISCSFADFVKDALGREKSMVEKELKYWRQGRWIRLLKTGSGVLRIWFMKYFL